MAISIADNFSFRAAKPLDRRQVFDTIQDMKNISALEIYDGLIAYNKEDQKTYQFNSNNTDDATLGKWKEFSGAGGGVGIEIDDSASSTTKTYSSDKIEKVIDSKINTVTSDYYKKFETDNLVGSIASGIIWKASVSTFADIATTYTAPEQGWTCTTDDTGIIYNFDGTDWNPISNSHTPDAVADTDTAKGIDGLLTSEKAKEYDDTVAKSHIHENSAILEKLTVNDEGALLYDQNEIGSVRIDDTSESEKNTYSSKKINELLTTTADKYEIVSDSRVTTTTTYSSAKLEGLLGNVTAMVNAYQNVGMIMNNSEGSASMPDGFIEMLGQEIAIGTYPELEQYFIDTYGKVNYFGGDGVSTYKMQDAGLNLDLVTNVMSSNSSAGQVASASSEYGRGYIAANAFNGNIKDSTKEFATAASSPTPQWLAIQYSEPKMINGFRVYKRVNNDGHESLKITLEASNDGTNWVTIKSFTTPGLIWSTTYIDFELDGPISYTRYRLNDLYSNGSYVNIQEWQNYYKSAKGFIKVSTGGPVTVANVIDIDDSSPSSLSTYSSAKIETMIASVASPSVSAIFSNVEREVGEYNGKPLYERTWFDVMNITGTNSAQSILVALDLSSIDIDRVVTIDSALSYGSSWTIHAGYYHTSDNMTYAPCYNKANKSITINCRLPNANTYTVDYIRIRYTKN